MPDTSQHASLWAKLARRRTSRTLQWRIVHYGFWSSIVFLAMNILDVFTPSLFQAHYIFIAVIYLAIQLTEIVLRDPLDLAEVLEGNGFALAPALFALLLKGIDWYSGYVVLTPVAREIANLWFWVAWIVFVFNVAISLRILSTQYGRNESIAPRS